MWVQVGLGVIDGRKLEEGGGLEPSAGNQIERHHTLTHTLTQPRNEQLHMSASGCAPRIAPRSLSPAPVLHPCPRLPRLVPTNRPVHPGNHTSLLSSAPRVVVRGRRREQLEQGARDQVARLEGTLSQGHEGQGWERVAAAGKPSPVPPLGVGVGVYTSKRHRCVVHRLLHEHPERRQEQEPVEAEG